MRLVLVALLLTGCRCEAHLESKASGDAGVHDLEGKILKRMDEINGAIGCVNSALDSAMNDRDQVMTIEECMRKGNLR